MVDPPILKMLIGAMILGLCAVGTVVGSKVFSDGYKMYESLRQIRTEISNQEWRVDPHPPPQYIGSGYDQIGLIMEGRRHNILDKDCLEDNENQARKLRRSIVAPQEKELVAVVNPNEFVHLKFSGKPIVTRNDYTFSILVYSSKNDLKEHELKIELTDGVNSIAQTFDFESAKPYLDNRPNNVLVYRPFLSWPFTRLPETLQGNVQVRSLKGETSSVVFLYPMIEEGLFPSSLISCSQYRGGEQLSYSAYNNLANEQTIAGTISFNLRPLWQASYLTPGIDPHFFYWATENEDYGITIKSDSKNTGRVVAEITSAGKASRIVSDITPVRDEPLFIVLRYSGRVFELLINNSNSAKVMTEEEIDFEVLSKSKFFIGSTPKSEDLSAYSQITHFLAVPAKQTIEELEAVRSRIQ